MKTYIINLPRSRERRENILSECARFKLEAEVFPGVDGKTLSESELRRLAFDLDRNPLCKAEIGCALSHLSIYRDMIEKNIPIALILEDDSVFNFDPSTLLADLERQTTNRADVYLLTHRSNRYISSRSNRIGDVRFYQGWNAVGGNGYVITNRAASNLFGFQAPIRYTCDDWKIFLFHELITLHVCEKEFIGLHTQLGHISRSLLEDERLDGSEPKKKLYYRTLRKQTPLLLKAKYQLRKIRYWHSLRYQ